MLKSMLTIITISLLFSLNSTAENLGNNPLEQYKGDIITQIDKSTFKSSTFAGNERLYMYDRRSGWQYFDNSYVYEANFTDGTHIQVGINPEFTKKQADDLVKEYMVELGRLPFALRNGLKSMWIHEGGDTWGGAGGQYNAIIVHTGMGQNYKEREDKDGGDGILAEIMLHEAVHAVFDKGIYSDPEYLEAQQKDVIFYNVYSEQHPTREDAASTFLGWLASRYAPGRISAEIKNTLDTKLAHRFAYFDKQNYNMAPFQKPNNFNPIVVDSNRLIYDTFSSSQNPMFNMSLLPPENFTPYFNIYANSTGYLPLRQDKNTTVANYTGESFDLKTDGGGKLSIGLSAGVNGQYSGNIDLKVLFICDDGTRLTKILSLKKNTYGFHDFDITIPKGPSKITKLKLIVKHQNIEFNSASTFVIDNFYIYHERGYADNSK